jgi:transposase InsO family protein
MKEYISKCDICLTHQSSPTKQTILQYDIITRPWAKVGAELKGRMLLVVSDYFSGYIEVERLQSTTASAVIKVLKIMFAWYGVPSEVVSDKFRHITSSPRYPQSNGKAENAVKTIKRLFSKCAEAKQSKYQTILDRCNTPT